MGTRADAGRRLRRGLRRTPIIGNWLDRARTLHRALRSPQMRVVTVANSRLAYARLWRNPRLYEQYLAESRLASYEGLAAICAGFAATSVIDAGCGSGHLLAEVVRRTGITDVVGFDNVRSAVRLARTTVPTGSFFAADICSVRLDRTFDVVLCSEVLEHLERPARALPRLLQLAAPGGHVVIAVPDGAVDTWRGHVNFWSREALAAFLEPYGPPEIRVFDDPVCPTLVAIVSVDAA